MTTRSKCLVAPAVIPAAAATVLTVEDGQTVLVKFVTLVNTSGSDRSVSLFVNSGSGDQRIWIGTVPTGTAVWLEPWVVLQPTWTLRWSGVGGVVIGSVHGAELEGVA